MDNDRENPQSILLQKIPSTPKKNISLAKNSCAFSLFPSCYLINEALANEINITQFGLCVREKFGEKEYKNKSEYA